MINIRHALFPQDAPAVLSIWRDFVAAAPVSFNPYPDTAYLGLKLGAIPTPKPAPPPHP